MSEAKEIKPSCWKPSTADWSFERFIPHGLVFRHREGALALSSVQLLHDEHIPEPHWEWIVSFSMRGQRHLTNKEMKRVLKDWKMEEFEEDNHERGIARKFWMAVDPQYRIPCPCKDEEIVTEGDYQWSRKLTGSHAHD